MEDSPEAEVFLTEKIKRWIRTALTTATLEDDIRERLRGYTTNRRSHDDKRTRATIPFELVKAVHDCIQSEEGTSTYMLENSLYLLKHIGHVPSWTYYYYKS